MISFSRTDTGRVRRSNQDALIEQHGLHAILGVADGMGGHNAGDVASAMTAELLPGYLREAVPSCDALRGAIRQVNHDIYLRQLHNADLQGMGTTLTVLWEDGDRLLLGHVGDSRAYRFHEDTLSQLSTDHTLVYEYAKAGIIRPDEMRTHPFRNIITRALGTEDDIEVDIVTIEKCPGDLFLMCSDGLYEYIEDDEIGSFLRSADRDRLQDTVEKMVSTALERGGSDNISVMLAEVEPDGR